MIIFINKVTFSTLVKKLEKQNVQIIPEMKTRGKSGGRAAKMQYLYVNNTCLYVLLNLDLI